jgi:hypothetical protein
MYSPFELVKIKPLMGNTKYSLFAYHFRNILFTHFTHTLYNKLYLFSPSSKITFYLAICKANQLYIVLMNWISGTLIDA